MLFYRIDYILLTTYETLSSLDKLSTVYTTACMYIVKECEHILDDMIHPLYRGYIYNCINLEIQRTANTVIRLAPSDVLRAGVPV